MNTPKPSDGIAWVTGASSGIGREVAIQLVAAGWTVAISARREDELAALSALYPGKMIVAPLDITDTAAVAATVAKIEAQAARPIMRAILNAGTYERDTGVNFNIERFKRHIDVNLSGTANCLAALLPGLLAARRGQIGIVGSLAGLSGLPGSVSYSAAKAGLIAMAESLNFDCRKAGVGLSMILPGFVRTPLTDKNTHPMPYLMEVGPAAQAILKGMDAGTFIIAFPAQLAWPLRFLRLLPASLYFPLVAKGTKW
jgi:NAD(P)-dependent dehydrogenase (short-subunit alcohol dehydrogenase family)